MDIKFLSNSTIEKCLTKEYDLIVFAAGYEHRCTYIPNIFKDKQACAIIVIGFDEFCNADTRAEANLFYMEHFCGNIILSASLDDEAITKAVAAILSNKLDSVNIFVDYTSMSRTWYASILNWARFGSDSREINIDFAYAPGKYEAQCRHRVISKMVCIPGCEGRPDPAGRAVAIVGLGYDGFAPLTVLDYLEPDDVIAFVASPGVVADSAERAIKENAILIDSADRPIARFSVNDVEGTVRGLSEIITPYLGIKNIVLVPLGPKTHVLASILISMKFPEVACLHVGGYVIDPVSIEAAGDVFVTSVFLSKQQYVE